MINPRDVIQQSIMPNYPWLAKKKTDFYSLRRKLSVMKSLGVPYDDATVAEADRIAELQAEEIASGLEEAGVQAQNLAQLEIVAMIAYLQSLGQKVTTPDSPDLNAQGEEDPQEKVAKQ